MMSMILSIAHNISTVGKNWYFKFWNGCRGQRFGGLRFSAPWYSPRGSKRGCAESWGGTQAFGGRLARAKIASRTGGHLEQRLYSRCISG